VILLHERGVDAGATEIRLFVRFQEKPAIIDERFRLDNHHTWQ